jgi:hypothetical protein
MLKHGPHTPPARAINTSKHNKSNADPLLPKTPIPGSRSTLAFSSSYPNPNGHQVTSSCGILLLVPVQPVLSFVLSLMVCPRENLSSGIKRKLRTEGFRHFAKQLAQKRQIRSIQTVGVLLPKVKSPFGKKSLRHAAPPLSLKAWECR